MNNVPYVGHLGYQKNIASVNRQYYGSGMKKYFANSISKCLEFQKVKVGHKHPAGLLQPLPIPKWKREVVIMYFITNLPKTTKQHYSIMVVVDKLTKVSHFILVMITHKEINIVDIYMRENNSITWNTQDNCVCQRSKIYIKFLESIIQRIWNKTKF